jgi:zinc/manganese transport system ATP-binding protein
MTTPIVSVEGLGLRFGQRQLWRDLTFQIERGEFLAVLGPNGAGKTSLLRILLGQLEPSSGHVVLDRSRIGYVPQQRAFDRDLPLRGRDLVRFGLDGHRWGLGRLGPHDRRRLEDAVAAVGATALADTPIGRLSGGEQQRLRVAQALVSDPSLLLADEPLLSLDLAYQQVIVHLLDERRRSAGTPVVFVTHDVNPILSAVDRVLYFGPDGWAIGPVDDVLTTETLSRLYGTEIDVLRVRGRVVVVGTPDAEHVHHVH